MHLAIATILALATTGFVNAAPQSYPIPYTQVGPTVATLSFYNGKACGVTGQRVPGAVVEVNDKCKKIKVPSKNVELVFSSSTYGSVTLFTDENCKNKGLPKPVRPVQNGGTVCMHPSEFQGENWGSVIKT